MVDVDRPARQRAREFVGEDLHIAGQHHQVDLEPVDEVQQPRLRFGLRVLRDGNVEERDAVPFDGLAMVGVVRDDCDDLRVQLAHPRAVEQVVEAVAELRHHDEHALLLLGRAERPQRVELVTERCEVCAHPLEVCPLAEREADAREEVVRERIVELFELDDVASVLHENTRERMDDPAALRACERDDVVEVWSGGSSWSGGCRCGSCCAGGHHRLLD